MVLYCDSIILYLYSIFLPVLNRSGDMCVEFRYNMYGFHIGALQVVLRSGTSDYNSRWEMTGEQSDRSEWRQARVTLNGVGSSQKVKVDERGAGWEG